jgi:hypothetical protein
MRAAGCHVGGVLFALFLFFRLFLLALVTLLAGLDDRTVRHHAPSMNPTAWRGGARRVAADNRLDRDVRPAPPSLDHERRAA